MPIFAKQGEYEPCGIFTKEHFLLILLTIIGIKISLKKTINKTHKEVKQIIKKCTIAMWIFEVVIILFKIITGEEKPDSGTIKWGATTSFSYFPKDHDKYFKEDVNLVDILRPYSKEQEEAFLRGFLGRMLFSGEEALKKVSVLSGGEKVRLMFSRMMLKCANVIILD